MIPLSERIVSYCQATGVRNATKPLQIASILEHSDEAIPAEKIWNLSQKERFPMSIGAVYTTLNWLLEADFVEKESGDDRKALFRIK